MAQGGELKNVSWAKINGQRYAFSYNHQTQAIEMKKDSLQGAVLHSFPNSTPVQAVEQRFSML